MNSRAPSPTACRTRWARPARPIRAARCRWPTSPTPARWRGRTPACSRSRRRRSFRCSASTRSSSASPARRTSSSLACAATCAISACSPRRSRTPSDPFSLDTITKAIASFERTLISGNSPYDRYALGLDDNAISASAKRGEVLFFDADFGAGVFRECSHCHGGFNFTASVDHSGTVAERPMHNNALYNLRCADFGLPNIDLPQCDTVPRRPSATAPARRRWGATRPTTPARSASPATPPTWASSRRRRCATSRSPAPYMHDGSIATLDEVLDHYTAGGRTITDGPYAGVGSRESGARPVHRPLRPHREAARRHPGVPRRAHRRGVHHQSALRRSVPAARLPRRLRSRRRRSRSTSWSRRSA